MKREEIGAAAAAACIFLFSSTLGGFVALALTSADRKKLDADYEVRAAEYDKDRAKWQAEEDEAHKLIKEIHAKLVPLPERDPVSGKRIIYPTSHEPYTFQNDADD